MSAEPRTSPIFPLPEVVFFPFSILRLHVFEPRFRSMTRDVLRGDGRMVIGHLKPGWENEYYESPPIYRIAGLGRVVDHRRHPDGKFDLTLEGIERVRIMDETQTEPYRVGRIESVSGCLMRPDEEGPALQRELRELQNAMRNLLTALPQMAGLYQKTLASNTHPGIIADLIANYFVADTYSKQCILEEQNIVRRIRLVGIQIGQMVDRHARAHYRDRL